MNTTLTITEQLTKNFDNELKALLLQDLEKFRAKQGAFNSNNQASIQDNDLLVA